MNLSRNTSWKSLEALRLFKTIEHLIKNSLAGRTKRLLGPRVGHPFFFSFRPFPSIRGSHSVLSASKSSCLQRLSPLHQLPAFLFSQDLKIFFLVSLFSSFLVTPFPSSFFLHTLWLSSWHVHTTSVCPLSSSFLTVYLNCIPDVLVSNLVFSRHSNSKPQQFHLYNFHLFYLFLCDRHRLRSIHQCWAYHWTVHFSFYSSW